VVKVAVAKAMAREGGEPLTVLEPISKQQLPPSTQFSMPYNFEMIKFLNIQPDNKLINNKYKCILIGLIMLQYRA